MNPIENNIDSNVELNKETWNNFIDLAIKFLDDNKLSSEEKNQLNQLIDSFNSERWEIINQSASNINEIKNEIELKRIISETEDYKETIEKFSKLSIQEIKNIQFIIWTSADWIFWINSYIAYKNSPISWVFEPSEISKWRRVWENMKWFIENFSKLNWVDAEIMAIILSNNISSNSFVFLDENWNITIFDKNNDQNIITFSETLSLEWLLHESFVKRDLWIITKQLNLITNENDKKNYILTLRNIIENYNYQREARQIFTRNTSRWVEIDLPLNSLNRDMRAVDLFWDYEELIISWEKFVNNWEWDFISEKNWRRLSVFNKQLLNIENLNNQRVIRPEPRPDNITENNSWLTSSIRPEPRPDNLINETISNNIERNLSRDFWNWLTTEWSKLLWRTWPNSCWAAVAWLIDTFMRSKWIRNSLNINTARNWANFNSILEQWNITPENPFIIQAWRSIYKITSESELRRSWLDIRNILNQRLEVKSRDISFPKESIAWEIIVFNQWAESDKATKARRDFWHVEIKWSDNMYYSYYKSRNAWWSTQERESWDPREYSRLTGFTWKAYRIEMKA